MKISLQNIKYPNYNLQKTNNQKASGFVVPEFSTSSLNTLSNYNKADISFKSNDFEKKRKKFEKKLQNIQYEEGFGSKNCDFIIKNLTEHNIKLAEKLCFAKDEKGKYLFKDKWAISSILLETQKTNADLAEKMCFLKDEKNNDFFLKKQTIIDVLSYSEACPELCTFAEKILFAKDENDNFLFSQRNLIPQILDKICLANIELAKKLCFAKDKNGEDLFKEKHLIPELLGKKKGAYIFEKLCFLKDENGKDIIEDKSILTTLKYPEKNVIIWEKIDNKALEDFFKALKGNWEVEIKSKRKNNGYEFIAKKKDFIGDSWITKKIISNEKGIMQKNNIEEQNNLIKAWAINSDKSVITDVKELNSEQNYISQINWQIEIYNDKNNEPSYIIASKPSKLLNGVFEITKYNLSDYPQDLDIIKLIKTNKMESTIKKLGLPKGEKLSDVKQQKDGSILYTQNYTHKGITTKRKYIKHFDKANNVDSYEYNYNIIDENDKKLLQMDKSWQKNQDGTTTTTINGEEYITKFDDDLYIATIQKNGKELKEINFKNKNKIDTKKIFDFIKTLPADLILLIEKCPLIYISNSKGSHINFYNDLTTKLSQPVISHELGHIADTLDSKKNHYKKLSDDIELNELYNEEMEAFRIEYPNTMVNTLRYFSPISSGSAATGLGETLAETLSIISSCNEDKDSTRLRKEYLIRFFPKTIAKCADLLGFNAIEN